VGDTPTKKLDSSFYEPISKQTIIFYKKIMSMNPNCA
jgi:hypothetical protein